MLSRGGDLADFTMVQHGLHTSQSLLGLCLSSCVKHDDMPFSVSA